MIYKSCTDVTRLGNILDPNTTAVIVVDVQNDFCSKAGCIEATGGELKMISEMIPNLQVFLEGVRSHGVPVIYLQHINSPETMSEAWLSREVWFDRNKMTLCERDTWGSEIIPELKPRPGDIVVKKHRYSGFADTRLDLILRAKKTRSIVVTGVSTNVCVDSTARDAFMRDYFVVLPEDCVASTVREFHVSALANLARYFGLITQSKFILEALSNRSNREEASL